MHSLATWWDVLKVAKEYNYFDTQAIGEVESFLHDPMKWSADHGGASSLSD
jgi:orotate phosphoribosyltransferase